MSTPGDRAVTEGAAEASDIQSGGNTLNTFSGTLIQSPPIFDKAVILQLGLGKPGNTGKIPQNKYQVEAGTKAQTPEESKAASERAKEWTKAEQKLLESPEINNARKRLEQLRTSIKALAAAGGSKYNRSPLGDGTYLIGIVAIPRVEQLIEATRTELQEVHFPAIREAYPGRIEEARIAKNGLFNPANYAPIDELLDKFYISHVYFSFGAPAALSQVGLFEREQGKLDAETERAVSGIPAGLAQEMKEFTDKLLERNGKVAKGEGTKFKGLLESYLEFLGNLPLRNILGDADLAEIAEKAQAILQGVDSEALRTDKRTRDYVTKEFTEIQQNLETLSLRPTRAFEAA